MVHAYKLHSKTSLKAIDADAWNMRAEQQDGTETYKSLACFVCCWTICHLSLPTILFSSHEAIIQPFRISASVSSSGDLPIVVMQTAVVVGLCGSFVHDRCGSPAAMLYGTFFATISCLGIEHLASTSGVIPEVLSVAIGSLIGGAVSMHIAAMCTGMMLVPSLWAPAVSVVLSAAVAMGCVDLQEIYQADFVSQTPSQRIAGLYGLLVMKFSIVGLISFAQGVFYSSPAQKESITRSNAASSLYQSWSAYLRTSIDSMLSRTCLFAMLTQMIPLLLGCVIHYLGLTATPTTGMVLLPWASLTVWAALLPALIRLTFPNMQQAFISSVFVVVVGIAYTAEVILSYSPPAGLNHMMCWHPLRAAIGAVAMGTTASVVAVEAMSTGALFSKHQQEEARQTGDEIIKAALLDFSMISPRKTEEEEPRPSFADPLAALYAPDTD